MTRPHRAQKRSPSSPATQPDGALPLSLGVAEPALEYGVRTVPLSKARAQLSQLVGAPPDAPIAAVTVHERLEALIVSPAQLERLVQRALEQRSRPADKRPLRGSLEIVGDIEEPLFTTSQLKPAGRRKRNVR